MNDSTTASCAIAARDTQSRSERCRLIDASPYCGSGASATASHCFCAGPAARRRDRSLAVLADRRIVAADVEQPDGTRSRQAGGDAIQRGNAAGGNQTVDVGSGHLASQRQRRKFELHFCLLPFDFCLSMIHPLAHRSSDSLPRGGGIASGVRMIAHSRRPRPRARVSIESSRRSAAAIARHHEHFSGASVIALITMAGTASRRRRRRPISRAVSGARRGSGARDDDEAGGDRIVQQGLQRADRFGELHELAGKLTRANERSVLQQHPQQHLHPFTGGIGCLEQPKRVAGRRGVDDDQVVAGRCASRLAPQDASRPSDRRPRGYRTARRSRAGRDPSARWRRAPLQSPNHRRRRPRRSH